jgi:hypothetical protein
MSARREVWTSYSSKCKGVPRISSLMYIEGYLITFIVEDNVGFLPELLLDNVGHGSYMCISHVVGLLVKINNT